ncbi:MAG: hypothetical protein ACPG8W_12130 [Candidatus Promineifilaceae bacterium]
MLERILLIGALVILIVAGCAGRVASSIAGEFDHEFETEFVDALHIPNEFTVTKRVNGDTVYSERVETNNFDESGHEFEHHDDIDIEDVTGLSLDFDEGGIQFNLSGTGQTGEEINISADLTQGNDSVVNIDIND